MIKPAILYKDEIIKKSKELVYSDDLPFYMGCPTNAPITILDDPGEEIFQFVSIGKDDKVMGYICFYLSKVTRSVSELRIISFDKENSLFFEDISKVLAHLFHKFKIHRIEWYCLDTNPICSRYDKLIYQYGGHKYHLHDNWKIRGKYHGSYLYEILFPDN